MLTFAHAAVQSLAILAGSVEGADDNELAGVGSPPRVVGEQGVDLSPVRRILLVGLVVEVQGRVIGGPLHSLQVDARQRCRTRNGGRLGDAEGAGDHEVRHLLRRPPLHRQCWI